jgi:D-inositol-3-phosphate glycosyltransferase
MISFVWTPSSFWTPPFPLVEGNGGTESFVLGQARELTRRGIENQVVTFRLGKKDGRASAPDVNFVDYADAVAMGTLTGDSILQTEPLSFASERTPFVMLHNPPYVERTRDFYVQGYAGRKLMANSKASADLWQQYLGLKKGDIAVVYPFAHAAFAKVKALVRKPGPTRVLFAGRLTVEKGFYTLLETLHQFAGDDSFRFDIVLAGKQGGEYAIIEKLVKAHPMLHIVPAQPGPQNMAALLVQYDILVMPSHGIMWREPFGMLSVEAQHAGCRVVASNIGGIPETDCGGLHVFEDGNPLAFEASIREAASQGRLSQAARTKASAQFTVSQSVDQLLSALAGDFPIYEPTQ